MLVVVAERDQCNTEASENHTQAKETEHEQSNAATTRRMSTSVKASAAVHDRGPPSARDLYLMAQEKLDGTLEEAFLVWLLEGFQVVPDRSHPSLLFSSIEAAPLFPREPSPYPDASFTRRMVLGWVPCGRSLSHSSSRYSPKMRIACVHWGRARPLLL
jgi:hypothetical protein